ncbi:MAG: hypothetical protein AAF371_11975 [Pseudomonadota bacterium]
MKFWMGLAMIAIGISLIPSGIGIIFTIPLFLLGLVLIVISILHGGLSAITYPFRRGRGRNE